MGWMAGLSAMMAIEKWAPWGRRVAVPFGVTLLIWGTLLVLGSFSPVVQPHQH
jgi:predicted metal-binding membrane protein